MRQFRARFTGSFAAPPGTVSMIADYRAAVDRELKATTKLARADLVQQLQRVRKRVQFRGHRDGLKAGLDRFITSGISESDRLQQLIRQATDECVTLVCAIARQIIGEQSISDSAGVRHRIEVALEQLADSRAFRIESHPDDVDAVRKIFAERGLECRSNSEIPRGDARITAPSGTIDLSVDRELEQTEKRLRHRAQTR